MAQFFRDHMCRAIDAPLREMGEPVAEAPPSPVAPDAKETVLSGKWFNPRHDSSLVWHLPSESDWALVWNRRLSLDREFDGIQLTRDRVLVHFRLPENLEFVAFDESDIHAQVPPA